MPRTAIVWLRRDLRVHDNPALVAAARAGRALPVFVVDDRLLGGRFPSPPRAWFLRRCLEELRAALRERGADLVAIGRWPATARCAPGADPILSPARCVWW
jgi:deoxyribodipyrimidine photo-lyase